MALICPMPQHITLNLSLIPATYRNQHCSCVLSLFFLWSEMNRLANNIIFPSDQIFSKYQCLLSPETVNLFYHKPFRCNNVSKCNSPPSGIGSESPRTTMFNIITTEWNALCVRGFRTKPSLLFCHEVNWVEPIYSAILSYMLLSIDLNSVLSTDSSVPISKYKMYIPLCLP